MDKHNHEYLRTLNKLRNAGIGGKICKPIAVRSLPDVFKQINELFHNGSNNFKGMIFFVMYDISDNRVRTLVAKYLIQKGCTRIQRSVYLANLNQEKYKQIHDDLAEVQACYDNDDSILIIPIPNDYINSMKIIGHSLDTDVIIGSKRVLFF